MSTQPPKWAASFLRWFCRPELLEETQGDIYELFYERVESLGPQKARIRFVWDIVRSFRWANCKNVTPNPSTIMLRNYIKIGFRNIGKHRLSSSINMVGLLVGISCFALLFLSARHEMGFDTFHRAHADIYRVLIGINDPQEGERVFGTTPGPMKQFLRESLSEVEEATALLHFGQITMEIVDSSNSQPAIFSEREYFVAQPNFFQLFNFPLVRGEAERVFDNPFSLILTASTAKKYFGEEDPIGRQVRCNRLGMLTVTGIMEDPPVQSHLQFDFLLPYKGMEQAYKESRFLTSWGDLIDHTYLLLKKGSSPQEVEASMDKLLVKHIPDAIDFTGVSLQALEDIHLNSSQIEMIPDSHPGSRFQVFFFLGIALFILLISGINYTNLATARVFNRVREIGVRKVIGATRKHILFQFLVEAILIVGISTLGAAVLSYVLMPYFETLSGQSLQGVWEDRGFLILGALVLVIGLGVLAGYLPALYVSQVKLEHIVKGKLGGKMRGTQLRKGLVVFQFILSMVMIALTSVVYLQLEYIQTKDLGFTKDPLIVVDINSGAARGNFQEMKTAFLSHAHIEAVTATSRVPGEWKNISEIHIFPQGIGANDSLISYFFAFDEDALETFDMKLLAGENFSGIPTKDSATILINEFLASKLNVADPIGREIWIPSRADYPFLIRGVVKDFHFQSLHQPIGPMVMGPWNNPIQAIDYFSCRVSPVGMQETLAHLTSVQETFDPETPLEYHFLSDQIARFYESESNTKTVLGLGALLSICIACLGLFGLSAMMVMKKIKEIGIRKVLGATTQQLMGLLSRQYAIQLGIAFVIASPIAYFLIQRWLENFSYRVSVNPLIFLSTGLLSMLVALATVSYWSYRAANTQPAETLNQE